MECVNIRFNIFWKSGNETFQMMNNLPKSIIKDANLSLVEGATEGAFTINRSPELEDEYFIPGVETSDSFDLIANYPELIYQCGVVSASFDNGCLTDVPDHIKKHCDRWGWVMTKKIEWFNNIATELIS